MKYVAAYALAVLGGNNSPNAQDILKIIGAGGGECDMEDANKVVSALQGKNLTDVIAEGKKKISSVPSGGGAAPAAASAAAPAAAAAAPAKETKKEEPKEESDEDMGFGLFD